MIYYVSNDPNKPSDPRYEFLGEEGVFNLFKDIKCLQADSETNGLNPYLKKLMTFQLGSDVVGHQVVIDCTTVNIYQYKELMESKMLIFHNAKFDLQFLYRNNIIPRKVYDTMLAEQVLYLGYRPGSLSYALKEVAHRGLNIDIDKTIRGQIRWRGIDPEVIVYGAGDVMHLEKIMGKQVAAAKKMGMLKAIQVECEAVPAVAYVEYCGIHLDPQKWGAKMKADKQRANDALKALNKFVIDLNDRRFIEAQLDLFNPDPVCNINWDAPAQVVPLAKALGFDTAGVSKSTGEENDSVGKYLKAQKGINDTFLELYFAYKDAAKAVSSFGMAHLDAINPITGRIHTSWKQIGTVTGRMSCGNTMDPDKELAQYKQCKTCIKPNLQQLPHDEVTRACFTATPGNLWLSADYSALEARLGADIYQEHSMIEEFNHGSGDMHSLCAKMVFHEELKDIEVKDVKKIRPDLRSKVKPIEFSQQFGGTAFAVKNNMGCTQEEAEAFVQAYAKGFPGITKFKAKGKKFFDEHGYIICCPTTGCRMTWQDFNTYMFGDATPEMHKTVKKWQERICLNGPTQHTGGVCIKTAITKIFNGIVDNGYFDKILMEAVVHDECNFEFPEELKDVFPKVVTDLMKEAAALYCKSVEIPAEASVGDHGIH